jgi:hypothetical protein
VVLMGQIESGGGFVQQQPARRAVGGRLPDLRQSPGQMGASPLAA